MNVFALLRAREPLVWILFAALAAAGALAATSLPSAIYPEVEFPRIVVVARGGDAPPDVTQVALTRPLEAALATVLGIERLHSKTIRGAAELSLQFVPGSDMQRALQLVQSALAEARGELPPTTELTVERVTTTSFPVLTFNLTGPTGFDARALRELADFVVRPALSKVAGVGHVDALGGDVREVEVLLDPERAAAHGLAPLEVAERLRDASVVRAVGRVEAAHALVTVMIASAPDDLAALRATPIAVGPDGGTIPLGAIAAVEEGAEDRTLRVSGPGAAGSETVQLSIARLPGASTPDVVDAVMAVAHDLARALPRGVTLTPVYDQAELVGESIASVRDAILLGILLCVLVIAAFLRDLRGGAVAALAVPLALGASFLPMKLMGQSLNLMSLGGLAVAIGLVIDDAIVVVEGIGRALQEGAAPADAAAHATRALMAPLVGTTLTTVVVFVPLAWLDGIVGRFFSALAATLSTAVLLSLALSVTLVPLAAARWLRPHRPRAPTAAGPPRGPWLGRAYSRVARPFLRWPWLGVLLGVGLLALGALSVGGVGTGFLPSMDEGAFVIDYALPAGTSLAETDRAAKKIDAVLAQVPEVVTFARRTGAELGPAAATMLNGGDIMVRLRPAAERERAIDEVIADVRQRLRDGAPEARIEFVQVLQDVLDDLAGNPRPIEIKLFGDDDRVLRRLAAEVAERIEPVPGLVDLDPGFEGLAPEERLTLDPDQAARLGLSAAALADRLDAALHGALAGTLRRPDRPLAVRVRYPDAERFDLDRLLALPPVLAPRDDGPARVTHVGAVMKAVPAESDVHLEREGQRAVVVVSADHEERDLGDLAADVEDHLAGLALGPGYRVEVGGQFRSQQKTVRDIGTVMGFGLIAVLLVLLVQFRRARLVLAVLATVPLSVVGALATLWATGIPLNASSLMGCVLLVGLVVKNGILLLEQYERCLEGGAMTTREALLEAGRTRIRPIAMTTVATVAGLAPLALGIGAGAEIQRPLAVAVMGGLVLATIASLVVLPALAVLLEGRVRRSAARAP
ncbi:MAG: efflux RND transporter permease subunit [Myxococcota bacterium]